jgi:hypothetical protein
MIQDMVRIQDSYRRVRIEPFWSQDSWSRYGTNPWICKTNPCFYEYLIRFPHPYYFTIERIFFWKSDDTDKKN